MALQAALLTTRAVLEYLMRSFDRFGPCKGPRTHPPLVRLDTRSHKLKTSQELVESSKRHPSLLMTVRVHLVVD